MATHSSVLAWRIPGTGEPCELPSMGWHRVGHEWIDIAVYMYKHFKIKEDIYIILTIYIFKIMYLH